jgi:hypothetical protein
LASYVLRELADSPDENFDPDTQVAFAKSLRTADSTIESEQQSWPKIQYILDQNKFTVTPITTSTSGMGGAK